MAKPPTWTGSVALVCFFITALALGFFWLYGSIEHPAVYVPTTVARTDRDVGATSQALAPDMSSPAVVLANSDVPEKYRAPAAAPARAELHGPVNATELKSRRRLVARPAKPLLPEAAQAFAAAPEEAAAVLPKFDRATAFAGF